MFREIVKNALTRGVKIILQAQEITGDDELFQSGENSSKKPSVRELKTLFGKGKSSRKDQAVAAFVLSRKAVRATIAGYRKNFDAVLLEVVKTLPVEEQFRILKFIKSMRGTYNHDAMGWGIRRSSVLDNLDIELLSSLWDSSPDVSSVFNTRSGMPRADTPSQNSFTVRKDYRSDLGWRVDFSPASDEEGAKELLRTGNYRWVLVPDEQKEGNRKFALLLKTATKSKYEIKAEVEASYAKAYADFDARAARKATPEEKAVKHVRAAPPLNTILVSVEDEYENNAAYRAANPDVVANDEGGTASSATPELGQLWDVFPAFTGAPNEQAKLRDALLEVVGRISSDDLMALLASGITPPVKKPKNPEKDSDLSALWEAADVWEDKPPVNNAELEAIFGKKPRSHKKKVG